MFVCWLFDPDEQAIDRASANVYSNWTPLSEPICYLSLLTMRRRIMDLQFITTMDCIDNDPHASVIERRMRNSKTAGNVVAFSTSKISDCTSQSNDILNRSIWSYLGDWIVLIRADLHFTFEQLEEVVELGFCHAICTTKKIFITQLPENLRNRPTLPFDNPWQSSLLKTATTRAHCMDKGQMSLYHCQQQHVIGFSVKNSNIVEKIVNVLLIPLLAFGFVKRRQRHHQTELADVLTSFIVSKMKFLCVNVGKFWWSWSILISIAAQRSTSQRLSGIKFSLLMTYGLGSKSHWMGCGLNCLVMHSLTENNWKMPKTPRNSHKECNALGRYRNGVWTQP